MSARNPRSFAAYRSTKFPKSAYYEAMRARRAKSGSVKKIVVVPGVTRIAGAYRRSNPQSHEETHYNDCTMSTTATTGGAIPTFTSVSPTAAAPDNPAVANLVGIKQGTTKNTRIGNKLHLYQIRIKGQVELASQANGDVIRVILVQDTQANGATPAISDVLEGNGAGGAATIDSFQNMDNIDRFRILKDKYVNLNALIGVSSTSNTPIYKEFKMSHKCRARIDYSSVTGVVTELKSNNFFIILISANGFAVLNATSRVYWKE